MDRSMIARSLGIRRRITVLFVAITLTILFPTFFVTYRWSLSSRKRLQELTLTQGYDAWLYFVNEKRALLDRVVRLAASHSLGHADPGQADTSVAPILNDIKKSLYLDMAVVISSDGRAVAGDVYVNLFGGTRAGFENVFLQRLREGTVSGFWSDVSGQSWLMASTPLQEGGDGARNPRFFLVGYKIDSDFAADLKRWFGIGVQFIPRNSLSIGASDALAQGPHEKAWKDLIYFQKPYLILGDMPEAMTGDTLAFLVRDLRGEAIALGTMHLLPKDLPGFGRNLFFVYWVILVVLSVFLVFVGRFLGGRITEPLVRLREAIRSVTESGDLSERLLVPQEEEMGALTSEFNAMLETIERTNEELKATGKKLSVLYGDLLEQKKFTSEILSAASSLVLLLLPDGRVKFVNEASETILGFRPEEVVGRSWFDNFLPFRARTAVRQIFDEVLKGNFENYRRVESDILRKDGKESSILWNNSLLKDADGQVTSILSIGVDISAVKKVEGELRRKIVELERFYRVTMDRERVIMQLKKEIAELKQRCG